MCRRAFLAACVVLVLAVVNDMTFGYEADPPNWEDQNDYVIVMGQPVIDGIISGGEWDEAEWINIGNNVYGDDTWPNCTPNDLTDVRWANLWSAETNLIYVAVQGTDANHNFGTYVSWNTQDDLEIYVDAGQSNVSGYNSDYRYGQQYFIGSDGSGGGWVYLNHEPVDAVMPGGYAVNVDSNVITYEFAITPYQELDLINPANSIIKTLQVGDVVGLDVCMVTADESEVTTFMCEHSYPVSLWNNAGNLLDLTLVGVFLTAYNESPSNGQSDVSDDVVLSWRPGKYAALHDVYFGTDYNDVADANTSDSAGIYRGRQNLDANSYDTNNYAADGLCSGRTYYWRIDEVNDADPCSPWKGAVWSFTVECDMVVSELLDWTDFDFTDLAAFAQQWLVAGCAPPHQSWCCGADLDYSGEVDFLDFALLGRNWPTYQSAMELSQYGITWQFSSAVEYGQFVNGDYWVVGPVSITSVSPAWDGSRHGSMVDPATIASQGYRAGLDLSFNPSLRATFPLTLNGVTSLVSTIGLPEINPGGSHEGIDIAAVLTVVNEPVPAGTFRPPYVAGPKPLYNVSQVNYSAVPTLPLPPGATMPNLTNVMTRVWLDHTGMRGNAGGSLHPKGNMPPYPRDSTLQMSTVATALLVDSPNRNEYINRMIQLGIDLYHCHLNNGDAWRAYGGFGSGRKWPILFAGIVLGDTNMQNPIETTSACCCLTGTVRKFGEDGHTYYGQPTVEYPDGQPLWGQDCTSGMYEYNKQTGSGDRDCRDPAGIAQNDGYRICCTSHAWVGEALAAHIMNATTIWDYDAFFDYVDWWVCCETQTSVHTYGNDFIEDMWNAYRN